MAYFVLHPHRMPSSSPYKAPFKGNPILILKALHMKPHNDPYGKLIDPFKRTLQRNPILKIKVPVLRPHSIPYGSPYKAPFEEIPL